MGQLKVVGGLGRGGEVFWNGESISQHVTAVIMKFSASHLPSAELSLRTDQPVAEVDDGQAVAYHDCVWCRHCGGHPLEDL